MYNLLLLLLTLPVIGMQSLFAMEQKINISNTAQENFDKKANSELLSLISRLRDFRALDQDSVINQIKELIARGANINGADYSGATLLSRAVVAKNPELVKFLLDTGADANSTSEQQDAISALTPIQLAIMNLLDDKSVEKSQRILKLLLLRGASLDTVGKKEQKAFDIVKVISGRANLNKLRGRVSKVIRDVQNYNQDIKKAVEANTPMPSVLAQLIADYTYSSQNNQQSQDNQLQQNDDEDENNEENNLESE